MFRLENELTSTSLSNPARETFGPFWYCIWNLSVHRYVDLDQTPPQSRYQMIFLGAFAEFMRLEVGRAGAVASSPRYLALSCQFDMLCDRHLKMIEC